MKLYIYHALLAFDAPKLGKAGKKEYIVEAVVIAKDEQDLLTQATPADLQTEPTLWQMIGALGEANANERQRIVLSHAFLR